MALYSYKGAWPTRLPNRLKFPDGSTRTDKTTFTPEEIADAGWIEVEDPPAVDYPNKLEWDGQNWSVREPNASETSLKWQEIRNECERKLAETDYKVIKAVESGQSLDPVIVQYRQELRDLYNNVNNVDPWNVKYPYPQYPDEEAV
jgi:hypothetical protein